MTVRVHYGCQSFIVTEGDPAALARQAFDILTSAPQMSGIWNLETASGQVYLLLTRSTPVAVEDIDESLDYPQNSPDFSELAAPGVTSSDGSDPRARAGATDSPPPA